MLVSVLLYYQVIRYTNWQKRKRESSSRSANIYIVCLVNCGTEIDTS